MAQEATLSLSGEPTLDRPSRGPWSTAFRALLRRKLALIAIVYIVVFYVAGIFAPIAAPYGYKEQNLNQALESPSLKHPFGTDRLGRDLFSRIIYAARTTVVITILTALTGGLIIGPALGLLAGYRRGIVDSAINRVGEVVASLPELMILIMLSATIRERLNTWVAGYYDLPVIGELFKEGFASIFVLFLVLTLVGWVGSMRFIRAQTLQLRESEYVLAARSLGAGTWRVVLQHILPNLSYLLVLGTAASFGAIALSEIGLSFLGLGVRPPTASFGEMILSGSSIRTLEAHPHLFFFPSLFAVSLLLAFNLLGDALNDVLNPRTRNL